jgi:hypothetical protein
MGNEALKENSIFLCGLIMEKLVYDIIPRNKCSNPKGFRLVLLVKLSTFLPYFLARLVAR